MDSEMACVAMRTLCKTLLSCSSVRRRQKIEPPSVNPAGPDRPLRLGCPAGAFCQLPRALLKASALDDCNPRLHHERTFC